MIALYCGGNSFVIKGGIPTQNSTAAVELSTENIRCLKTKIKDLELKLLQKQERVLQYLYILPF